MNFHILSFCVFLSLCFLWSIGKTLWLLMKNKQSKFQFVLPVFWDSTSYSVIIQFWMILMKPDDALAHRWPCEFLICVSGLRRLERNLNNLRCIHVFDLVLKYGSDRNEGNWLQLLFYFFVLVCIVASVIGTTFFSGVFQISDWTFLVLHFDGNVCNWIPKVIRHRLGHFWRFLSDYASFCRLHIFVDWNLHELLNCYPFLTRLSFFDGLFEGCSG